LNSLEVAPGGLEDLQGVYCLMENAFPANEIKTYNQLERLLLKGKYKLLLAKHRVTGEMIGYAFIYEMEHFKLWWLDYIAIIPEFQSSGYGSIFFNKLVNMTGVDFFGLLIEVEIPEVIEGPTKDTQLRRVRFYERLGAERLTIRYELPTKDGGFPMYLYFRASSSGVKLTAEQITQAITSAFEYIHADISIDIRKKILSGIGAQ
jgi:hypothetical protein